MIATAESARTRWVAEYREARKVRQFERRFEMLTIPSSLYPTVSHKAYIAAIDSKLFVSLQVPRENGRFGVGGTLKRHVTGPYRRLPA